MSDVWGPILWVAVLMIAFTYGTYVYFEPTFESEPTYVQNEVIIVDRIAKGKHQLSGTIPVKNECYGLSVRVVDQANWTYHLEFTTWQEPYRDCPNTTATRPFSVTKYAPAVGVRFTASIDEAPLAIRVLEYYD